MESSLVLALISLTSSAAYLLGTRGLGLERRGLGAAALHLLEYLGAGAVFFAVNLVVGGGLILLARRAQSHFVSLYLVDDVSVLALSVLQGLVFQAWRAAPRGSGPATSRREDRSLAPRESDR
jgi:uncharacterized membrane protein